MILNKIEAGKKIQNFSDSIGKMNKIADNLAWYRRKKGWSQDEMGAVFSLNRHKISSYERGTTPDLIMLTEICKDLGVYLHEFVYDDMTQFDFKKSSSIESTEAVSNLTNVKGYVQNLKAILADMEDELKKF